MKITVITALALALFVLLFPFFIASSFPAEALPEPSVSAAKPANELPLYSPEPKPSPSAPAEAVYVDVLTSGGVAKMELEEYLNGVVAAEMPASFETEALKAQAVAARTYTLYRMLCSPSPNHPNAHVCTNSACCKAYKTTDELRERWGGDFEANLEKINGAVSSTAGQCLIYDGEPILAAFHSSSAGETASSAEVWGGSLPYLVSVDSAESADEVPNYVFAAAVSHGDFRDTFKAAFPDAELEGEPSGWLGALERTDSGRVERAEIGGVSVAGSELRALFSLRSTCFTLEVTESDVVFTTTGYGHGVGMSQYGANAMASGGAVFSDILAHYYPGSHLSGIDELPFFQRRS